MKIKKTVGNSKMVDYINGKARKSYTIHTECGQEFHAKAMGSQSYECIGMKFSSLRAVKTHIEADGSNEEADEAEVPMNEQGTIWDCVHPCALIVLMLDPHTETESRTLQTLDSYGWLDEKGQPDNAKADREFTRVENLTGAQSDDN